MENARKNSATREQGNCSRLVRIAGYLLLATGFSLVAVCATAGKAKAEPIRLAKFVPARYDKPGVRSESIAQLFDIERSAPPAVPVVKREAPAAAPSSSATVEQGKDAARAAGGTEHGTRAKE